MDLSVSGEVAGILNITPDSFSDGGRFEDLEVAVAHGLAMRREGAAIIDVGGESTRPGADSVPLAVELDRVVPVVARLRAADAEAWISVDTSKAEVARAAWAAGADIINDVTGLRGDPAMAETVAETGAGLVIMHMRGVPRTMQRDPVYTDVTAEVGEFFEAQRERALAAGIPNERIVFDPGIGFGKEVDHNLTLLRELGRLETAGRPLMLGVSRKSFFGRLFGAGLEERDELTAACTALARTAGVRLHRVHQVGPSLRALRLAEMLLGDRCGVKTIASGAFHGRLDASG